MVIRQTRRSFSIGPLSNDDNAQSRPQGHLCGRGEKIDDPDKSCPNLLVHWLTHSTSQGL